MMDGLWRMGDLDASTVGSDAVVVLDRRSGRTRLLTNDEARMLYACDAYRPVEEHAARWTHRQEIQAVENMASKAPRWLRKVMRNAGESLETEVGEKVRPHLEKLRGMAEAGFLESSEAVGQAPVTTSAPPPVTTFGFTTRHRPEELERAIRSYAANLDKYGRAAGFTVIDDSGEPETERTSREHLGALSRELGFPIRFAGRAQRGAWAEAIAEEAGVDPAVTRFALLGDERCPITTGSARNALLLDAATEMYVLVDDDGVCRAAEVPEKLEGWELTSAPDPLEFWFYESRDETLAKAPWIEADMAGLHERLLGKEVGRLWEEMGPAETTWASRPFETDLIKRGARVRATMAGIVGDSGLGGSAYLFTEPVSRKRLTQSEAFYRAVVRSRQVLRAARRPLVSDASLCMAGNLGLDHTELLPPFSPVQRNSDGLFGRMLKHCMPRSVMGYLPEAAHHDPKATRTQDIEELLDVERGVRYAEYLMHLMRDWPGAQRVCDSEAALGQLGRYFRDAAGQSQQDLEAMVRTGMIHRESKRLAYDRSGEAKELPGYYHELRLRQLDVIRQGLARDDRLTPRDLVDRAGSAEAARALARELTRMNGELLEAWAAIRAAAVRLRAADRRLSEPV